MGLGLKLRQAFPDIAIFKDTGNYRVFHGRNLPSFVKDYVMRRYLNAEGELDREAITAFLDRHIPTTGSEVKSRLGADEEVTLLTRFIVDTDMRWDKKRFAIPDADIKLADGVIPETLVARFRDDLVDGERWGIIKLRYVEPSGKKRGYVEMVDYKPFRPYKVDLEYFKRCRRQFSIDEWVDVLLLSMEYNPGSFADSGQKLEFLTRLLPFVEPRLNLIELAPKSTGKSYVFGNLSKYGWLVSGGKVSRVKLFYDKGKQQTGIMKNHDVVVFDEVKTISFADPAEMNAILKSYLESGKATIDNVEFISDCGVVLAGNIDLTAQMRPRRENYFDELPQFRESALLERFHGFIEGWKLPRLTKESVVSDWSLNAEYFSEILHALRPRPEYAQLVGEVMMADPHSDLRDTKAVERLATAYAKLLFPHVTSADELDLDEFARYCLAPAIHRRAVIRAQCHAIDQEFKLEMPDIGLRGYTGDALLAAATLTVTTDRSDWGDEPDQEPWSANEEEVVNWLHDFIGDDEEDDDEEEDENEDDENEDDDEYDKNDDRIFAPELLDIPPDELAWVVATSAVECQLPDKYERQSIEGRCVDMAGICITDNHELLALIQVLYADTELSEAIDTLNGCAQSFDWAFDSTLDRKKTTVAMQQVLAVAEERTLSVDEVARCNQADIIVTSLDMNSPIFLGEVLPKMPRDTQDTEYYKSFKRYIEHLLMWFDLNRGAHDHASVTITVPQPPPGFGRPPKIHRVLKGFEAIAGMQELKDLVRKDVIDVIRNPAEYRRYGLNLPNGMLLYGPPGCGKTFFAERLAEEAGFNFQKLIVSDVLSRWVGGTEEQLKKVFDEAREGAPTILFFDEIDALMPDRNSDDLLKGAKVTVNEFLSQLDNIGDSGVFVVCSTNRPLALDKAILRTGRLEKCVFIPPPDHEARRAMFEMYLRHRPLDEASVDYDRLAALTANYVSSDIRFICDESARKLVGSGLPITMEVLERTIATRPSSINADDIAYYEKVRAQMEGRRGRRPKIGFS
ncbi:MAG: BREX system Lon protease-like protein BrxL [Mediterranea sp.]|jgi:ATP-dependent Lon protease|nr:BREX system Lon protease-like protein BrxL [Mediterranea sp.]